MSKNTSILLTLIIIFLASYFLYWKGEVALEKAAEKFSILAFENTDARCNEESLSFFIENTQPEETLYEISIVLSEKILLDKTTLSVPAQTRKTVQPKKEILENICNQTLDFKYEIIINNESSNLSVYKLITL